VKEDVVEGSRGVGVTEDSGLVEAWVLWKACLLERGVCVSAGGSGVGGGGEAGGLLFLLFFCGLLFECWFEDYVAGAYTEGGGDEEGEETATGH